MKKIIYFVLLFLMVFVCGCSSETTSEHNHTFSSEYSYDENYHWHKSTCEHDVTSNKELHQFDDGVLKEDENLGQVLVYTCKICGYTKKTSSGVHEHTFSDKYSYDENFHWHESTCEHNVTSNKEYHQFDDGILNVDNETNEEYTIYTCKICGYIKKIITEDENKNNIEIAEEIIANVYDSCTSENTRGKALKSGAKALKRRPKQSKLIEIIQNPSELSGTFYYQEENVEAFLKVSSEPLSYAFGLLEFFLQNGLPENDFSDKLYFNPLIHVIGNEMLYTKITLLSDKTLAIDYGHYHMIIGEDGDETFVMSYGYNDDLSSDYMNYLNFEYYSNSVSLIYLNATLNWKDEIDLAIDYLKDADDFSVLPLELMKEMYLEDGVEKPIDYHYDKNNPNHVVLPTYDTNSFTSPNIIQEYFMYVHYNAKVSFPLVSTIINDGVLEYVVGSEMRMVEIPAEVKIIENLGSNPENTQNKLYHYGLFFHKIDIEFGKSAFDRVERIDSIFIDSLERNEEFEKQIKEHFPNVKFYYQDEWEIKYELILPKTTVVEDNPDHTHVFTRQVQTDEYLAQEANCLHGICYYYVCELCDKHGNQFYEVGEKGDHNYVEYYTERDYVWYRCTICGLQYSHNTKDTEHHYVLIEVVPPTCTEDGYSLYRCKITGEEKIETRERLHHSFTDGTQCTRCHTEMITYEEHDFYYKRIDKIEAGNFNFFVIYMRCKICNDEYTQYSYFEGHRFENGICKDCGLIEHEHKYGEEFIADGMRYHCCNICGYIEPLEIYTVTFDTNCEIEVESQNVNPKNRIKEPNIIERPGYIFEGWFINDEQWDFIRNIVTSDITLVAKWHAIFKTMVINNEITITGLNIDNVTSFEIPAIIDGTPVSNIGEEAFAGNTNLESIIILDGVKTIGNSAFAYCENLVGVVIPDSVTTIGEGAFSGCTFLISITIPDSVTSIGEDAFSGCTSLTSITIPDSVVSIGASAFSGCTAVTNIIISNGVTEIENGLFSGCTSITIIVIPDSVTSIGVYAFNGCTSLTNIILFNNLTSIGEGAFSGCTSLTSITIPESVTSIGASAFSGCTSLTSITIPDSVTSIGAYAFNGCTSLKNIILRNNLTNIGEGAFSGCTSLTSITIPESVTRIGASAFSGCTSLTIYCKATEKPAGWDDDWNSDGVAVVWDYKG